MAMVAPTGDRRIRIRWKYRTKDGSEVRVFKHRRRIQAPSALLFAAIFAAALICAGIATTADSMMVLLFFAGLVPFILLLAAVPLYVLIRLQAKIVVDDESIRCVGWFRTIRIPFSEIIESELGSYHFQVRSKKHRIRADSMIENVRGLSELVETRLAGVGKSGPFSPLDEAREQKVFRYTASFKNFTQFVLTVCVLGVIGILLERPEEFQWGWVIMMAPFVAGIPVAAWVVYRTTTTVEFLDDFLLWQRGRRTVTVPYDAIYSVTVKKTWNGFQYLELRWEDNRLRLPGALYPFDRLVDQLALRTQVSWAGTWPLRFPVAMRYRASAEQYVGLPTGMFFTVLSVYFVIDAPQSNWFSIAIGVMGGAVGLCLMACVTVLQMTNDSPRKLQLRRRKITFGRHRFAVVDFRNCRSYRARDVTDVYLRVDDSFSTTHSLEITLGDRRFVLQNFGHDVPLVPLYQLLREAYCGESKQMAGAGPIGVPHDQSEGFEHADQ